MTSPAPAANPILLLDRARFPRDKPCGGGLTLRAVKQLPFSVAPVVEDTVDRLELGLGYRRRFTKRSVEPLVLMTQRRRLDQCGTFGERGREIQTVVYGLVQVERYRLCGGHKPRARK